MRECAIQLGNWLPRQHVFQKADYARAREYEHNRWDEFSSNRGD
jgi:hypothetical protein